jgi:mannosyl-3-phosphoglycerate phosphatase family protein
MKYLISTDLDGTLLDHHTYSWEAAKPGLALCRERSVPIILNTSKTLAEVDELARQLLLNAPMVVENGSALVLPKELKLGTNFKETARSKEPVIRLDDGREAVMFGTERATILSFIEYVRRKHGWRFQGFHDWSTEQIAENTGLTTDAAQLAAKKQFSEPFVWNDS